MSVHRAGYERDGIPREVILLEFMLSVCSCHVAAFAVLANFLKKYIFDFIHIFIIILANSKKNPIKIQKLFFWQVL